MKLQGLIHGKQYLYLHFSSLHATVVKKKEKCDQKFILTRIKWISYYLEFKIRFKEGFWLTILVEVIKQVFF